MISLLLYKREMKGSIKVLLIFAAVITLYVTVIIRMYDPEMMKTLDDFVKVMPELMAISSYFSVKVLGNMMRT